MTSNQPYQVFVGNVPQGTTEDRLRQVFSTVGKVVNVRVMSDRGDPKKGYAFVEYDNPDAALSAIQYLANVEVEGRKLRVGFSNNSNLEAIAKQRGITGHATAGKSVESALSQLTLHEMYDIVSHLKELAEGKPEELRLLLISHPQIAEAIVQMQVKIGMIRQMGADSQPPAPVLERPPVPPPAPPVAPPAFPPPPPYQAFPVRSPPPPPPPPPSLLGQSLANMSQEVIKQIMDLTDEQLAQLDPTRKQMLVDIRQALLAQNRG